MNRRSFLAAAGIAPVAVSLASASQDGSLIRPMIDDSPSAIMRRWACPNFKAEVAGAEKAGRELAPDTARLLPRSEAPEWLQAMVPERQSYVFVACHRGRIVRATWWVR